MPGRTGLALIAAMLLVGATANAGAERLSLEQAEFGFRLIDRLAAAGGNPNVIVSPASLAATLAYLDLGADTGMRAALAKTLGYGPDDGAAGLGALGTRRRSWPPCRPAGGRSASPMPSSSTRTRRSFPTRSRRWRMPA